MRPETSMSAWIPALHAGMTESSSRYQDSTETLAPFLFSKEDTKDTKNTKKRIFLAPSMSRARSKGAPSSDTRFLLCALCVLCGRYSDSGLRDGLNGWNGWNDWNKFISATSAAPELSCRNFCRCAVFDRWKTSDRPAPLDRRGSRRLRRKFRKLSRHNCCRTT